MEYFDVKADAARMEEMLAVSGGERAVPIIVDGDTVTVGYGGT